MILTIFEDLLGTLLFFAPIFIICILIMIIFHKRPNPTTAKASNQSTLSALKKAAICCLIDVGIISLLALLNLLGLGGVNYGAGAWGDWALFLAIFMTIPVLIAFIYFLVAYLKATDKVTRQQNLPAFAFSIFSALSLAVIFILVIVFSF